MNDNLQISRDRLEEMRDAVRGDGDGRGRTHIANGFEWLYAELTGKTPNYLKISCEKTTEHKESGETVVKYYPKPDATKSDTPAHPELVSSRILDQSPADFQKQKLSEMTPQETKNADKTSKNQINEEIRDTNEVGS